MADLFAAFEDLSPKSRASLKASSWELVGEELNTASGDVGPASLNKKVTIVGNGEEDAEGNVQLDDTGILFNESTLTTGEKGDTLVGVGTQYGFFVENSMVFTGGGSDTINAEGVWGGISLSGSELHAEGGNVVINGLAEVIDRLDPNYRATYGVSALFGSKVITGTGNDSINGEGGTAGISVASNSSIDTGSGNDSINGIAGETNIGTGVGVNIGSEINTGSGNDSIYGEGALSGILVGFNSFFGAIDATSSIDTGTGDDLIVGKSEVFGINVQSGEIDGQKFFSEINTGAGDDTVDAIIGGFAGGGKINLGAGNDTLIGDGFDSGIAFNADGGLEIGQLEGTEDKIVLDDGTYTYSEDGSNSSLTNGSGGKMNIINFELISGINGTIKDDIENEMGAVALEDGNTYNVVDGFLEVIV